MNLIKWILVLVLVSLIAWIGASWWVSSQFLTMAIVDYDPSEEHKIVAGLNLPQADSEQVTFTNGEVTLAGSFYAHPDPNNCAVILLPGIGGNRTQVLPALPIFWNRGCHVLAYDPRGTGASDRVFRTFGFLEKKDNADAIRWLTTRTELPASSIGIWGPSFGAAVGLLTLEEVERLAFVIADSTFHSFDQVAYDTIAIIANPTLATLLTPVVLAFLEFRTGLEVDATVPSQAVKDVQTPVLLIHALEDPAMSLSHSQTVYAARTNERVELEITDWGAGHADSAIINPGAYEAIVNEFLDRQLVH